MFKSLHFAVNGDGAPARVANTGERAAAKETRASKRARDCAGFFAWSSPSSAAPRGWRTFFSSTAGTVQLDIATDPRTIFRRSCNGLLEDRLNLLRLPPNVKVGQDFLSRGPTHYCAERLIS